MRSNDPPLAGSTEVPAIGEAGNAGGAGDVISFREAARVWFAIS